MSEASLEYVLSILHDAEEKSASNSLAALPTQYPVFGDDSKIELMRRVRAKLRERLKQLQLEAGISEDMATGEPPKTYDRGRICPKNHKVADGDRFCEVCGLLPTEGPWVDSRPELNGASADLKSIIYEAARMADEITRLENEYQIAESPAVADPAPEQAPPVAVQPTQVMSGPALSLEQQIPDCAVQAVGLSERVALVQGKLTFTSISDNQRKELPVKYITSIDFQPVTAGEGFILFHRLIDDRDLARAVPSAFSSLPTDWSKIDIFRAEFGPEQEAQFIALRDAVEQSIAAAKTDARLERLLELLKAKSVISDADLQ